VKEHHERTIAGAGKEQAHPVAVDEAFAPIRLACSYARQERRRNSQTEYVASAEANWTPVKSVTGRQGPAGT
jgi:hypothetical protein